ncbi:MAG: hypothetical protein GYB67_14445, partial [Chloroflexi bacterium]|nr:hypothetical protein [Chloroflexota bacterium]
LLQQMRGSDLTLREVITQNGGDPAAVVANALTSAADRTAEAVANGQITQEQADQLLARLESAYNEALDGALRDQRGGRGGNPLGGLLRQNQ